MEEHEKAWLACAIEGEGCISIRKAWLSPAARKMVKRGFAWRVTVQITNNSKEFCEKAQQIVGAGKIRAIHRERQDRKTTCIWRLPCSKSGVVLSEIKKHFTIPRKQRLAELAIKARELVKQHINRSVYDRELTDIYKEAKVLNSRGLSGFTTAY